jgi:hypothetical protein
MRTTAATRGWRAAALALLCLSGRASADPPENPSETDRQFKLACVAFLEAKAPNNPAAAAAAAFYRAHPAADVRPVTTEEMNQYYGTSNIPWDRVGGMVDSKSKIVFMLEHPSIGIVLRDPSGRLAPQPNLDAALARIGARLVHETSHLMVWEDMHEPLTGIVQNELLAHAREARYLERDQVTTPVGDNDGNWMTQVALLAAYRSGPSALGKFVRDIYGPESGYWSVYADPRRPASGIAARLADPKMPRGYRDYLSVQRDFWNDGARVSAARSYFDSTLPEYKDLNWPGEQ